MQKCIYFILLILGSISSLMYQPNVSRIIQSENRHTRQLLVKSAEMWTFHKNQVPSDNSRTPQLQATDSCFSSSAGSLNTRVSAKLNIAAQVYHTWPKGTAVLQNLSGSHNTDTSQSCPASRGWIQPCWCLWQSAVISWNRGSSGAGYFWFRYLYNIQVRGLHRALCSLGHRCCNLSGEHDHFSSHYYSFQVPQEYPCYQNPVFTVQRSVSASSPCACFH